jgi:hypothetical protein
MGYIGGCLSPAEVVHAPVAPAPLVGNQTREAHDPLRSIERRVSAGATGPLARDRDIQTQHVAFPSLHRAVRASGEIVARAVPDRAHARFTCVVAERSRARFFSRRESALNFTVDPAARKCEKARHRLP